MTTDIEATALNIHDALRSSPTNSQMHRALHAKGMIALGSFTPSGALSDLTIAPHLVSEVTPATVRFSHPSGDPRVRDAVPSGRGMAVKLSTPGGTHDLVGVSSPAFLVRDGAAFLELLAARAPDPATGVPDPDRMLAFGAAHPESSPAIRAAMGARVPTSYSSLTYNGLHTFFLVDAVGRRQPFRWSWVPVAGQVFFDAPVDEGLDLAAELNDRLANRHGDADFELVLHLGEPGDPTGDPTVIWPERPTLVAGRLELTAIAEDVEPIIFDPTNVTDGVALDDDDEILQLRRATYGLSYAARTSR
jgi:catalase